MTGDGVHNIALNEYRHRGKKKVIFRSQTAVRRIKTPPVLQARRASIQGTRGFQTCWKGWGSHPDHPSLHPEAGGSQELNWKPLQISRTPRKLWLVPLSVAEKWLVFKGSFPLSHYKVTTSSPVSAASRLNGLSF